MGLSTRIFRISSTDIQFQSLNFINKLEKKSQSTPQISKESCYLKYLEWIQEVICDIVTGKLKND